MTAVTPPGGYSTFPQPPGISSALIDPETGLLATEYCPQVFTEFFRKQDVPTEVCNLHLGFGDQFAAAPPPAALRPAEDGLGQGQMAPRSKPAEPRRSTHPFRRWLRRLFGGGSGSDDADEGGGGGGGKGQDDGRGKGGRGGRDG